ncbi:hypothetical protein BD779DRAFT_125294 [Infundibulicybe gibba]|nr:hypothetical protein BD779DRAFT_125294 [Infundibulicybe gibba]
MESLLDGTHFVMEAMTLNGPGHVPHSFVILDEPKPFSRPTLVPDVKPPIGPVGWLQPIVTHHIGVEYYVGRDESSDKLPRCSTIYKRQDSLETHPHGDVVSFLVWSYAS